MTGASFLTNGASLEDCHTNFFALTDICGIKWIVYRENDQPPSVEVTEGPVLQSFARCIDCNLLSVWRRVPKRALVSNCSYDMPPPPRHYDDKNYVSQRKELWIFWYGEKPDDIKKVLSPQLTEVPDISGTWENVLSYEARTLLYKALHIVLERCLLNRDFIRLGRWFIQPFDGPEKSLQKASHLSFAFSYFVHGESHVCVALDVRQHPAVRKLSLNHINNAKSQTPPLQVILAPFGISASLIGPCNKSHDQNVTKMLRDWEKFYPMSQNGYYTRNSQGDFVMMPQAVEVMLAGVRMLYPTCYVLVTDLDSSANFGVSQPSNITKAAHASRDTDECNALKLDAFSIEPSPYTGNNHPLLSSSEMFRRLETIPETEMAWLDGMCVDPDATSLPNEEANHTNIPTLISQHWNFTNPGRYVKKKHKSKQSSREKSKDRSKFNSKFPFHKKSEALDESAWAVDHTAIQMPGGVNVGGVPVGGHRTNSANCSMRPPNSVRAVDTSVQSPASVGAVPTPLGSAMTPKGGPSSVRTPCDMTASLVSPAEYKAPLTPKSVPSSYPVSSPFPTSDKKTEMKNDQDDSCLSNGGGGSLVAATASPSGVTTYVSSLIVSNSDQQVEKLQLPLKRPHLPLKEYESEIGQESEYFAEHLYDTEDMQHWLNYPVKKFCRLPEKAEDPPRPMYRRPSQSSDSPTDSQPVRCDDENTRQMIDFSEETLPSDIFDLSEEEKPTNLFTSEGLMPSMSDLNNIFEEDETEPPVTVPTPPGSNKPALLEDDSLNYTKVKTTVAMRVDPTGNLPHDQLAKMFPTPPSHEHNPVASPADITSSDADHLSQHHCVKMEPLSPEADHSEWTTISDDLGIMLASSKYAPLKRLYSDDFDSIVGPGYTPLISGPPARSNRSNNSGNSSSGPNSVGTPTGLASSKAGMSPISPLASVEGPRSQQGPGSVGGGFQGNSVGHQHDPAPSPHFLNKAEELDQKTIEISSVLLNIGLMDSLMNLHRDHNFASCIMCVCSNDCNIRGRDASVYVPDKGSDDFDCMCGFSAVVNRKLAYHAGLFYEDEKEVTGLTEDLYYRKNPSLLVAAKPGDNIAEIPNSLIELVQKQSSLSLTQHSSIVKYSNQYLKSSSHTQATVSTVEKMDANEVIFSVLDQIVTLTQTKNVGTSEPHKLDESQKDSCIHKWTLLQVPGPFCSEDIIRVMKSLRPILNDALHAKKVISGSRDSSTLSVLGPLTWRQFHMMAGPLTKGNTDDQVEPLPVPSVLVGHEKSLMSISPLALRFWDVLAIEPFSQPRDIAYIVVAPDNPFLLEHTKKFFRNLSVSYETCRLGRHAPITKVLGDGILKVGKKQAEKLANDETDSWFELIGDSPTASLVRLYSKVCHHYLLPLLHPLPLDRSLLDGGVSQRQVLTEKPPASPMPPPNSANHDGLTVNNSHMQLPLGMQEKPVKYGDTEDVNGKENALGGMSDPGAEDNGEGDTPAIVIYMVDPFTLHEGNYDSRLACLGLIQSFSQMLPRLNDLMRHNIHLQLVTLNSIFELTQSRRQPRLADQLRGLAFSVYSQSQRPLRYQRDCKTLTGFGPASSAEQYLKQNSAKAEHVGHLYCPSYVLSPLPIKKKTASEVEEGGDRSATVLFCNYFLSEDQHWLLATCCDDRGELLKTITINIEIPNKTRRKRASARRVGLRKLMDWILGIMAMALVPWRLVVGRIGRIGHGELRGWSVLLSRKALQRASKDLRGMCKWPGDVPSILSACLVSVEPDPTLRLMADQFTPDERFGQTASNCQLSTPRDATCTHILVFPTSAKAQSSQKADKDEIAENDDYNPLLDINFEDIDNVEGAMDDIADFKDLFNDNDWSGGGGQPGSPKSPTRNSISRPNSPGGMMHDRSDQFRYGQEVPGDQIEVQQQPLALGYLVSTAPTGQMPKWFWSTCPHLENVCPVFLKTSLHINVASVMQGGDDGFTPVPKSGKVHSLDSTYTADVLRFVLEGYNSLSWLSLNPETHDRRSCFPVHVQILQQMYNSHAALF